MAEIKPGSVEAFVCDRHRRIYCWVDETQSHHDQLIEDDLKKLWSNNADIGVNHLGRNPAAVLCLVGLDPHT